MKKEQLEEAIKLDYQIEKYEQIVKTMKNEKAFPNAHFVMVKDNTFNSMIELPKEIEKSVIELVENHVLILKQKFEKL